MDAATSRARRLPIRVTTALSATAVALAAGFGALVPVNAADVEIPLKKPRDAKGRVIVDQPAAPAPDDAVAGTSSASPSRQAAPPGEPVPNWPKTVPEAKAEAEAKAKPESIPKAWTEAEIADAKARCKVILDKIDAIVLPEPSFRHGDCGAPAPVRIIALGRKPEIAFSPPAVVTCGMVGALHTWVTKDLQPLAEQHLGSPIIKIENMSDYSCRNAYGRTKTKLSEHGRANALDIRGFVTAKGELAYVLDGWGETRRAAAARLEAAKIAQEKAAAAARPAEASAGTKSTGGAAEVRSTLVEGAPGAESSKPAHSIAPAHLGGPKPDNPAARTSVRKFLHAAHQSACRIFGTTLGPEANNAHLNHFHVDMAPRERSNFCQ